MSKMISEELIKIFDAQSIALTSYEGSDAFVAVFGVPQKGTLNVTTEQAIERVYSAVRRSAEILSPIHAHGSSGRP